MGKTTKNIEKKSSILSVYCWGIGSNKNGTVLAMYMTKFGDKGGFSPDLKQVSTSLRLLLVLTRL